MIEVRKLSYRYPRRAEPALAGISLEVHRGELLLLLGRNGAGKTTLAKHLGGLLLPDEGEVIVDGHSTGDGDLWEVRRRVGLLFQNPLDQIVGNTLIEDVAIGPENLGCPREEIARRVARALELVGLADKRDLSPLGLSGGELQRLALAGVLAMEPDYLVLDEPFGGVDRQTQEGLLRLLDELRAGGRGVVLISQDAELHEYADRVALLSNGRLLGWGPPEELFHDEAAFAKVDLEPPQLLRLYCSLRGKLNLNPWPLNVEGLAEELKPRLRPASPIDDLNRAPTPTCRRANVLEARDLSFSYNYGRPDEVRALRGINLAIEEGSFVGLTGPSGSGKSTLVQLLAGLLHPDVGVVRFRSREVKGPMAGVGLVFQNPSEQLFAEDLHRELTYGLRELGLGRAERARRAREACAAVGLEYDRERSPFALSGGEQVRLSIATALALEPEVLILDETLTALDPPSRGELVEHLLELNREGMTIIIVSHRLGELLGRCDRVFILNGGRLIASGRPEELLDRGELELPPVTRLLLRLGFPPAFTAEEAFHILQPFLKFPIL